MADFAQKPRTFRFSDGVSRVDLGRSSAYWEMAGGRRCISEHTVDRSGRVVETYFFSSEGLPSLNPAELFEEVKAAHLTYKHDPNIDVSVRMVEDDNGVSVCALDVVIADNDRLYRERKPYWRWYRTENPRIEIWSLYQTYLAARRSGAPFIMIEGETGDPQWGDRNMFETILVATEGELRTRLVDFPSREPLETYAKFNYGIIDVRDQSRPFNESTFSLAENYAP